MRMPSFFANDIKRDLEVDGCPLKENLLGKPALLMNAMCIVLL